MEEALNEIPKNEENSIRKFGMRDKIGYAFGDFGCNMSFAIISAYMADFFTQYIGITAYAWSVIIILTKIWDGVNDPIMGTVMDAVKIGKDNDKFKPWMRIGMVGLAFASALVFLPIPNAPYWLKIFVCVGSYLTWDLFYTLFNVPYGAMNCAISANPNERTSLSTWRSIGAGLGYMIAAAVLPSFVYDANDNLIGGRFVWIALIMGIVSFGIFFLCLKMTTERVIVPREKQQKYSLHKALKAFGHNRPLIAMCLAAFAMYVFFNSTSSTVKWIVQVYFGNASTLITIASLISLVPMIVLLPLIKPLTKKFGKRISAGVPLLFSTIVSLIMCFVKFPQSTVGAYLYLIGVMLVQVGGGVFQIAGWAMITDCVDYQEVQTGRREECSVYAMYSLFRKVAQGIALSLPLLCMEWVGYNPKPASGQITDQLAGVGSKMLTMSCVLMLIGSAIMAIAMLLIYNLGKKELNEVEKALGRGGNDLDLNEAIQASKD